MKTLVELNAEPRRWVWNNRYQLEDVKAVGLMKNSFSLYASGEKVHLIHACRVVGLVDGFVPGPREARVGDVIWPRAVCNSNGITGLIFDGFDTDKINCQRCLKQAQKY